MLFINKLKNQIKKLNLKEKSFDTATKAKAKACEVITKAKAKVKGFDIKKVPTIIKTNVKYWVPATTAVLVIGFVTATTFFTFALKVEVDNTVVGYVTNELQYTSAVNQIEQQVTEETGETFVFDKTPVFSYTLVSKSAVGEDKVINNIEEIAKSDLEKGYSFEIDNNQAMFITNKDEVLELLNSMLLKAIDPLEDAKVSFSSQFKFTEDTFNKEKLVTLEELKNNLYLVNDSTVYTVLAFDTASSIANQKGISVTNLAEYNKDVDLTNLVVGQTLKLTPAKYQLNISKEKIVKSEEKVAFTTTEVKSNDLVEGSSKLITAGVDGVNEITAKALFINGILQSQEVIETKAIKPAVNAEVAIGVKPNKYPVTFTTSANTSSLVSASVGKYSWPVPGKYNISSPYGARWGSFHPAIDIPAPTGTPTIATDSGTIIKAGRTAGGLGISIEIQHDNGTISRYGHLSSVSVTAGQRVTKGAVIGAVGSTGNSTGAHLHFELIINGSTTNPEPMLVK
ncbi:MAG: M23 family metallopeptidase [Clostridia bacterium]